MTCLWDSLNAIHNLANADLPPLFQVRLYLPWLKVLGPDLSQNLHTHLQGLSRS